MLYRSTILGQASGSLAGTTFSRNKGGQYTRSRAVPTNPNSIGQQQVRAFFTAAAVGWKALSQANRNLYDDYAASTPITNVLGESINLTGFQWYVGLTVLSSRIAGTFTEAAPGPATPGLLATSVTGVAISVATGATLTLANAGAAGTPLALVGVGPVLSDGVSNTKGPVSTMSATNADPTGAITLNRANYPYQALATGQRRVIETVIVDGDDFRRSTIQRFLATVVA